MKKYEKERWNSVLMCVTEENKREKKQKEGTSLNIHSVRDIKKEYSRCGGERKEENNEGHPQPHYLDRNLGREVRGVP